MLTFTSAELNHLRSLAAAVHETAGDIAPLTARAVAQCLSGAVRLLGMQYGLDQMRKACAAIVVHESAWSTSLCSLPGGTPVMALATIARGILALAGPANMRAALAFWACETDAATMARIAA